MNPTLTTSSCTMSGEYKYSQPNPVPTAHITVNRNRLKTYGTNVFLKDNSNFELELWNPKPIRVLARIKVNGVEVSGGGIVINPGQRLYLERFVDEDRKFKFSTYEAENSEDGKKAIKNNGDISVSFYDEVFPCFKVSPTPWVQPYWWQHDLTIPNQPIIYGNGTNYQFNDNTNFYCNTNVVGMTADSNSTGINETIETGRVEKGEKSDQNLIDTFGEFSFFACAIYNIKILPESQKPTEIGEIRSYCTGCGRRWRSTENFCPTCGTAKSN